MSLLSKQDHDLAIAALGIVVEMEDPEDPAIVQMKQLLQWLRLQRARKFTDEKDVLQ
jgi:hypothetical protein